MADHRPTPDAIMQLGFGFLASKTLLSAVELGVFTELAKGELDGETLRRRLGLHPRASADFLDALVALGMLERTGAVYRNTAAADLYLDRDKPDYIGGILEMMNARLYRYWGRLTEGLRSGEPQNEARDGDGDSFASIYADPANLRSFLGGMTGVSLPNARAIAGAFPWGDHSSVADIGCAQGGCIVEIVRAHAHLSGIGFDLPPVGPVFEEHVNRHGLAQRLRFQSGDFFKDKLPGTDVLIMGHILHDWDLAEKRALLQKAYDALPDGGALLVYDMMIDDERRTNAAGLLMSLNMLIETPGGFDYTGADCVAWMREAGFREARVQHLQGPYSMAVGVK